MPLKQKDVKQKIDLYLENTLCLFSRCIDWSTRKEGDEYITTITNEELPNVVVDVTFTDEEDQLNIQMGDVTNYVDLDGDNKIFAVVCFDLMKQVDAIKK